MIRALLDVNVLIALLDRDHVHHARAREWFTSDGTPSWASCAITQNGFVRVVSQARYPNPVTVSAAGQTLRRACASQAHEFWTCDYSILDSDAIRGELLSSRSVTDVYLLGLAVRHEGQLVTFDSRVPVGAVPGATAQHLTVL